MRERDDDEFELLSIFFMQATVCVDEKFEFSE